MNKNERLSKIVKSVLDLKIAKALRDEKPSAAVYIETLSKEAKLSLFKSILSEGYEGILTNNSLIVYFEETEVSN